MKRRQALIGVLLCTIIGCGDNGPTLEPVHGVVTLDGKPLAGKTLQFIPEPGTPGQGAGASTDENGKYTLLAVRPGATSDRSGAPAGKYRVIVTEPMFPIDMPVQDSSSNEPTPAIGVPVRKGPRKQAIPPIYGHPKMTPLIVTVPENGGEINLKLSTRPQAPKR